MSSNQIAPSSSNLQGQYAGFVTRLLAILVDLGLILVIMVVIGLSFDLIMSFFRIDDVFASLIKDLVDRYQFVDNLLRILAALGTFYFIFFIYYVTLHATTAGITIGKALLGVRVVRMDGTPLTFGRCTRRYLTFLLSALPFFAGLLWVIIDDRRQGWHDKLSDTCVIYDWPAQEDENFLSGLRNRIRYVQATRHRVGDGSDSVEETDQQPAETTPVA